MIKSMTGYGRAESGGIAVEVRSLNSKQLDVNVRLPHAFRGAEHEIRARVGKALERGKIDVSVWLSGDSASVASADSTAAEAIDAALFEAYRRRLKSLTKVYLWNAISKTLLTQSILHLPGVLVGGRDKITPAEEQSLLAAADQALARLGEFREQEGAQLIADLLARVDKIQALMAAVAPFEQPRVEAVRRRMREAIEAAGAAVDANRLEHEIVFWVEKLDITEEKVRLANHCNYFREVAASESSAGRKLGFIAQEMGREINTMGSKANDAQIQRIVVEMKDELEKIKEQVLNIL